jgi:nucleotide-binding universal stress UspA family protein
MYQAIVVGTDGSATATKAVRRAAELAGVTGATLHVVSGVRLPSRSLAVSGEGGAYAIAQAAGEWDAETVQGVQQMLTTLAAEFPGVATKTHAVPDAAVEALLGVAEREGAGLIVVGSRGMTGLGRVKGSVPNSVAHKAVCDVLIVYTTGE